MHVPEAGRAQHFAQAVTHTLVLLVMTLLAACAQSGQVFEPTNNRAVTATTAPTTYTFTLNINITTHGANHQNKPFSALLFRDGTLFAAQYNNGSTAGTDMTSGTGTATLVLNGVDTNGCPTGTPAALEAGTYELYFAVQYAAETPHTLNPVPACGGNGWMQSSMNGAVAGNLYGVKGSVNVTGNTTYNISNANLAQFRTAHLRLSRPSLAELRGAMLATLNATAYAASQCNRWRSLRPCRRRFNDGRCRRRDTPVAGRQLQIFLLRRRLTGRPLSVSALTARPPAPSPCNSIPVEPRPSIAAAFTLIP
jgi:hypothetical protein